MIKYINSVATLGKYHQLLTFESFLEQEAV